jgi:dihydrofolate reductase
MKTPIYLIAAADAKNGIGIKGKLPWKLKKDLAFFKKKTIKTQDANRLNMVVMGRTTWESIPSDHRPLSARKNVVLTRKKDYDAPGATVVGSIDDAVKEAEERVEAIYVIGGAKVYEQFMKRKDLTGIYLTKIGKEYKCDTFFPKIPPSFKPKKLKTAEEDGVRFEFLLYKKDK